jgi:predicted nucleotide-binding protein (sugar kinase/HSP70/actin superfamily)
LHEKGLELIDKAQNMLQLISAKSKIKKLSKKIERNQDEPIPIIVVGDLYLILEPAINNHIFEKLGKLGIIPYRSFYLSHFLRRSGKIIGPWGKNSFKSKLKFAKKYMDKTMTYGTLESVGDTVRMLKEKKIKGIIHMHSFTCMPEVINQIIYKKIAKDFKVPLLELSIGEHQTEAHQDTRLEAFVDLLRKKN